ncbi:MAG TPA: NUDIX domain-containing protein [Streptosporangiaceae bacterium]
MAEVGEHRVIRAAGGVLWRPGAAGTEIAIVHRPRYDDWSHPKGKRLPGEHVLLTAIREIREETGLGAVLGRPLTESVYEVSGGTKHVSFWAARCSEAADFVPNDEVDRLAWLPPAAARERLSYERDVALLDELTALPVRTAPLIVLRHAEAGRKPEPSGVRAAAEDLARPLDASGAADAQALAGVLASYGRCQVMSSAAERCLATVRPYAQVAGAAVRAEPALTVVPGHLAAEALLTAAAGRDAAAARNGSAGNGSPTAPPAADQGIRLAIELAVSGEPAIICAHRENLPAIIDAVFSALGASQPAGEPLGKSEFWVLHAAGARLVAAERHGVGF